jgi:regulator of protease activity HflC (stomatin/prohibitin superfamily)
MSISSILGFISLAGWLIVVAGVALAITNAAQQRSTRGGIMLAGIGLLIGILFFVASSGVVVVGATQVAVVFQAIGGGDEAGSLWPNPLGPGVHIIVPIINEPVIYSTEVRSYSMSSAPDEGQLRRTDAVEARTADGQQVSLDVSVLYSIDPTLANTVHLRWQNRFEEGFVRPTVRSFVREQVAFYTVNDLYGGADIEAADSGETARSRLPELQSNLTEDLSVVFQENGLMLQELLLRDITFSEEFIRAVEARQVAQQQAEQANQEAARARTIATGQANAAREAARGEADAILFRAQAEAEALRLVNEQLANNPQLLQWRYIENLADNVRLILLPNNSPFLFDLQQLQTEAGVTTAPVEATEPAVTPPSGQNP